MRRFAVVGVALSIGVCGLTEVGTAANPRIAAVQVGLKAHGFDPGPVDGLSGPLTRRALASFQRTRKLPIDGRLDRKTRRALGARGRPLLDSVSSPSARSAGTLPCSSSGCGDTGFRGMPSTVVSHA